MKIFRRRLLKAFLMKWRKLSKGVLSSMPYEYLQWTREKEPIPKDVPRGHMVVYVGEKYRRFVLWVDFLHHPLFRPLLDRAQEEYEFSPHRWGLCIPCDESSFVGILHHVGAVPQHGRRMQLYL